MALPRPAHHGAPADVRRLLLIHPGALGDLVQALPAIGAVRVRYPDAALALLTGDDLAPLATTLAVADEVLAVDARAAYRGGVAAQLRAFGAAAVAARAWRPDAAATFKAGAPWAALARASGATLCVGLTRGPVGRALLSRPIDPPADRHHEDRYADVARALGAVPARSVPARWPAASPTLRAMLDRAARGGPIVALAPGGARNVKQDTARKRWAPERWAALAARLVEASPTAHLVLLGGGDDRAEADRVRGAVAAGRVTDLVGRTTVPEARAAIARAAACVVHDSGLLHVAATTATPVVAVFGPTNPRILCPRRAGVAALWSPARTRACQDGRTGAVAACSTPCCIERVGVDEVLAAVGAALASGAPGDGRCPTPRPGGSA